MDLMPFSMLWLHLPSFAWLESKMRCRTTTHRPGVQTTTPMWNQRATWHAQQRKKQMLTTTWTKAPRHNSWSYDPQLHIRIIIIPQFTRGPLQDQVTYKNVKQTLTPPRFNFILLIHNEIDWKDDNYKVRKLNQETAKRMVGTIGPGMTQELKQWKNSQKILLTMTHELKQQKNWLEKWGQEWQNIYFADFSLWLADFS